MFPRINIIACHIGPQAISGNFVMEHCFMYAIDQTVTAYDGNTHYTLQAGAFCLIQKGCLLQFNRDSKRSQTVTVTFDKALLAIFQNKHKVQTGQPNLSTAFTLAGQSDMVTMFVAGLAPFYANGNTLDERFADLKREELLMILLHLNPEFASILFNEQVNPRADLPTFMNRNFRFNVAIEHFAYLTGRSLSGFKRDFQKIFNATPGQWLVQRRLEEAFMLITKRKHRPAEIYQELGFEDLTHFSFAFKKKYGKAPTSFLKRRN